ncbi:hypothetical protein GCM10010156_06970 [Planobispora rosea]|uniref:DUF1330 domain-containing protein n=1 Tax=Planobispora rosea TaxID=35762 RepID=B5LSZ1_PLARO|nr:DUF1330 domain-containing protein [Planobispora rosea]ACG70938.1 hypothetical protein [Planobispora rosea]GGS51060.1 hypothetical protein GCM10010156_06970 [Planobispora rosea]GIH82861.1 hypothetical protein Pro02_12690 [Planobispora rosea]
MPAYAIAHLRDPEKLHPEVPEYIERIQATMDPFSGRFIVHGGAMDVREGRWPGSVVILEFPSMEDARDWYDSAAYQEILRLRTDHLEGDLIIVEGVGPGYDPAAKAAELRKLL